MCRVVCHLLDDDLVGAGRRLTRVATASLAAADGALDVATARAGAADPARALARGFSLTRTADGRLVRQVADVGPRAGLVTTVADGEIRSTTDG